MRKKGKKTDIEISGANPDKNGSIGAEFADMNREKDGASINNACGGDGADGYNTGNTENADCNNEKNGGCLNGQNNGKQRGDCDNAADPQGGPGAPDGDSAANAREAAGGTQPGQDTRPGHGKQAEPGSQPEPDAQDQIQIEFNNVITGLVEKLNAAEAQSKEYLDRWQRNAADFDNYKRRTQNEMDRLYTSSAADVIAVFLPVADSIERAVGTNAQAAANASGGNGPETGAAAENKKSAPADAQDPYLEGLKLIERQIGDALKKLGVTQLPGAGEQFDPNLHEAVMHVEDESLGHNVIAEVFQKGYMYKDRVVRHSVVKVAN